MKIDEIEEPAALDSQARHHSKYFLSFLKEPFSDSVSDSIKQNLAFGGTFLWVWGKVSVFLEEFISAHGAISAITCNRACAEHVMQ